MSQSGEEKDSRLDRAVSVVQAVGQYLLKKCSETAGLELTKVQGVYWRAVQRRMIVAQLEELIDDNLKAIRSNNIQMPYELMKSLFECDPAIESSFTKFLDDRDITIALPKSPSPKQYDPHEGEEVDGGGSPLRLLGEDEADTGLVVVPRHLQSIDRSGAACIHPNCFAKVMMQNDVVIDNEEEELPDKGGFLLQGWLALNFLKDKLKERMNDSKKSNAVAVVGEEDFDSPLTDIKEIHSMEDIEYYSSSDDDYDLLLDKMYDQEYLSSPDGRITSYKPMAAATIDQDDDDDGLRKDRIKGKSRRPPWTAVTERIPFVLSNFRFKHIVKTGGYYEDEKRANRETTRDRHDKLKELWNKAARWPLFTYWLIFVQTAIVIITLSIYGVAPVGYVPFTEVALVRQSDLSVNVLEREITPNIWIGPPRDALVLLGANYGPCMRRDRLLYEAIDRDRDYEASQSGCCVRRDGSGCVQVATASMCQERLASFVFYDSLIDTSLYTNRSVCGTSPRTCLSPPSQSSAWQVSSISDWPICTEDNAPSSSDTNNTNNNIHLTCEVTGRPCCVGIQAVCMITTRENCDFLEGTFHEDAFLCSQVDCLKTTCGLTPFSAPDNPDQLQRLGLAMFLHAGVMHLLITLVFNFIILRNLEKYLGWLSTTILYMGSGIGGNIISAVFVPYSPEVGPAASIFGVIGFFLVFIFFHWEMLYNPLWEMLKYLGIVFVLVLVGFLPYIDNYARIGGLIFGLLFSFVHVHYIPPWKATDKFEAFKRTIQHREADEKSAKQDRKLVAKKVLLAIGLLSIIPLYLVAFLFFLEYQDTWDGFTYLNCIFPTSFSDLCQDFGQNIRPRVSAMST